MNTPSNPSSRREFLKTSTLAAGALAAMSIPNAVHAAGSDTLKVGLIGCGGRGAGAANQALAADKGAVLHAMGDAFADAIEPKLQALSKERPGQVKVEDRKFVGFDAYKKVIDICDVVILTSPPGFRPVHLRAAVDAGKHIFCEKPMATDSVTARAVMQTIEDSQKKPISLVAGFCWRYSNAEKAVFEQVHKGAIGDMVAIYSTYNTGELWSKARQPAWSDMEWQMRNWLYFTWLSGDHIVEQAVHSIDKMAWAMKDEMPISCVAHGGRQVRTDPAFGHIYDHFSVAYEWKGGVRGFLYCRQQNGCANDNSDYIMGTKGQAYVTGFRAGHRVESAGQAIWKYAGPRNDMYQAEHDLLFKSIRDGKPHNDGQRMINSTLMAIMGRMAGYTGQQVTWQKVMTSKESLVPEKLEWGQIPVPPVPAPGKTKLI